MDKEEKKRLDDLTYGATSKELLTWAWWKMFNKKKAFKLWALLDKGMMWHFAFKKAQQS